jgi:hypothetical protein
MNSEPIVIKNPPKSWWPGDPRVEEFMPPVSAAIRHHIDWPSIEFTDIYNRAYEAVYNAIVKYDKSSPAPLPSPQAQTGGRKRHKSKRS